MCFCQGFFKGGIFPLNNGKESEFEVKKTILMNKKLNVE